VNVVCCQVEVSATS